MRASGATTNTEGTGRDPCWQAGFDHASKVLLEKPWQGEVDPLAGIAIHEAKD